MNTLIMYIKTLKYEYFILANNSLDHIVKMLNYMAFSMFSYKFCFVYSLIKIKIYKFLRVVWVILYLREKCLSTQKQILTSRNLIH